MVKLARSRAMTAFSPARVYRAVAKSGFKMDTRDRDREARPLVVW